MAVTPKMATVSPDFQTIVHEIGCMPHKASTVKTAPVMTTSMITTPIIVLIVI